MTESSPVVTVSVQFPDLSVQEFADIRTHLTADHPGRVVVGHEAHRWYCASSDPETVSTLTHALAAAISGEKLNFDDEEALEDLSQEYADWLDESAEIDDAQDGPVVSFSVHLPALSRDEFADLLAAVRRNHPRRIVLGEQRGHSHHEIADRHQLQARLPALRAAVAGQTLSPDHTVALIPLLNDYASWLSDPANGAVSTPEEKDQPGAHTH